ncbi:MAG: hypothetical protein NC126_02695 [Clostridium sp.]|nr:hypothetical protein [Clostridium sp.]
MQMKTVKTVFTIVLAGLLLLITGVMALCVRGEWSISGYQYSDAVRDVIRFFSLFEIAASIGLGFLNRKKFTIAVIIVTNLFMLYKLTGTF